MTTQNIRLSPFLIIAITAVVATVLGTLALTASYTLNNTAAIKAVGVSVYWYSNRTSPVTTIDWGTLAPEETVNKIIYIHNNGTIPAALSMTTSEWVPSTAANYITVTWNCSDYVLPAGHVVGATLTLSVNSTTNGLTNFSFSIIITGTEQ